MRAVDMTKQSPFPSNQPQVGPIPAELTELKQHPLGTAVPSMGDLAYLALRDDMEDHGQREPITLFEGTVLDGWHRYRVCMELGINPILRPLAQDDDPVAFVKSTNFLRRHLTDSQKVAIALVLQDYAYRGRQNKQTPSVYLPKTALELANELNVSVTTIKDGGAAKDAGLLDAVVNESLTIKQAAQIARGTPAKAPSKAKPKEKLDPAVDPINVTQLQETQEAVKVLSEENDFLNDRLAVESMDATPEEKQAAAETITELRAKVKVLEVELRAVKSTRDGYMQENAQLKKQVAMQRKQMDKVTA